MKESLGERIRRLRKERHLSQTDLGNLVGVTISWISQIEKNKATPSAELLNSFATTFQVPIRELLQDQDQHMEIISRIKLVEVLIETKQPEEAEQVILDLLTTQDVPPQEKISLHVHLAECRYQQKRYNEALQLLQPIIESLEAENHHDGRLLAWIRNKMGKNFFKKSEYTNAFYNYQKAYDLICRFEDFDILAAHISYNVGMTLRRKGFDKGAIPYLERSRHFFENRQTLWDLAHSIFEQGKALKNIKNYGKAAECFDKAKALFETLNLKKWSNEVQITYASSILAQQDHQKAIIQLQETIVSLEKEQDRAGVAFVLTKIADIYLTQGELEESRSALQRAETIVYDHDLLNTLEAGECFSTYSKHFLYVEKYETSIDYALKAGEIFGTINLIRDQAASLQFAVEAYERLGEITKALMLEKQRSKLLEELSKEGM